MSMQATIRALIGVFVVLSVECALIQTINAEAPTTTSPEFDSFFEAVIMSDLDGVKAALAKGMDVNAKKEGVTALMLAASDGNVDLVNLLLENKADVNITADAAMPGTAMSFAISTGQAQVVQILLDHKAEYEMAYEDYKMTHLMIAASNSNVNQNLEVVRILLARGANKNPKSIDGKTALNYAEETLRTQRELQADPLAISNATKVVEMLK